MTGSVPSHREFLSIFICHLLFCLMGFSCLLPCLCPPRLLVHQDFEAPQGCEMRLHSLPAVNRTREDPAFSGTSWGLYMSKSAPSVSANKLVV